MSFGNVLGQQTDLSQYATESEVDTKISTATNDMATQSWVNQQGFAGWTQICQWTNAGAQNCIFKNVPCALKLSFSANNSFIQGDVSLTFPNTATVVIGRIGSNGSSDSTINWFFPVCYIEGTLVGSDSFMIETFNYYSTSTSSRSTTLLGIINLNQNTRISFGCPANSGFTAILYAMY